MILFTAAHQPKQEHALLHQFFDEGLMCLHVRKPDASPEALILWLSQIKESYRDRLVLHQHHELALAMGVERLHIPEYQRREGASPDRPGYRYSTSVHDMASFNLLCPEYRYALLSPVFPSISKPGYQAGQPFREQVAAQRVNTQTALIALGGIDRHSLPQLRGLGFDDFAVLGGVWMQVDPLSAFRALVHQTV